MIKVVAISGSSRKHSLNTGLLRTAQDLAPRGMFIELADISNIPAYDPDAEADEFPEVVRQLAHEIHRADAVLIATPEYNYSIPGMLKNAIDWISRLEEQPLDGKAIGIIGASMSTLGTARAQYHLRQILVFLNGLVMNRPEIFVSSAHEKSDSRGALTDERTRALLADFLVHMRAWVKAVKRMNTDEQNHVVYGPSGDSVSRQRDARDRSVRTG